MEREVHYVVTVIMDFTRIAQRADKEMVNLSKVSLHFMHVCIDASYEGNAFSLTVYSPGATTIAF